MQMRIWKDSPSALNYGIHLPASFFSFLGASKPVTLFRVEPAHHRPVFRCAPRKEDLGFQPVTGFADAYPLHMLSMASVRDLAQKTHYAIPNLSIRRFRANIVVEGLRAYEEDHWKKVHFVLGGRNGSRPSGGQGQDKGVIVHAACRTVRCRLPNVDPDTGVRHPVEPDKTLKSFRCIDPGAEKHACLGLQLVPAVQGVLFTLFHLGFF
jgi:uncharacterized protein YcbX